MINTCIIVLLVKIQFSVSLQIYPIIFKSHTFSFLFIKILQFNSREMFVLIYSDFARIFPVYNDISKSS